MLALIGTSHLDLDGYDRLRKLLGHLKPSVIGIEETSDDFDETSNLVRALSDTQTFENALANAKKKFPNADSETLKQWLSSVHYENRAIGEYSNANGVPILYCDNPQELEKVDFEAEAGRKESSLNRRIETFLRQSPENARLDIRQEYSLTEYPVKDCAELVAFYQARDKHTEQILRSQTGNIVYVCGLDHIFGDYHPNLFDRLSDLNPKRIKLSEADKL